MKCRETSLWIFFSALALFVAWNVRGRWELDSGEALDKPTSRGARVEAPLEEKQSADVGAVSAAAELSDGFSASDATRKVATPDRWQFQVLDLDGNAIADASCSWTCLTNDVLGYFPTRSESLWLWRMQSRTQRILDASEQAVSDSQGAVRFASSPVEADALGSVIWVTHAGFQARALLVGPQMLDWPAGPIELAPAALSVALVVDASGTPLPNARIVQQALLPASEPTNTKDMELRARRALLRTFETDAHGEAVLHSVPGEQYIEANTRDGNSLPAYLQHTTDLTLMIAGSQSVAGSVVSVEGQPLGEWAVVHASGVVTGSEQRIPLSQSTVSDGRYGPLLLSHDSSFRAYELQLIQGDNEVLTRTIGILPDGDSSQVDFRFRAGNRTWFQLVDQDTKQGITDARLELAWHDVDGHPSVVSGKTKEDGWCMLDGVPIHAKYDIKATAQGYREYSKVNGYIEPDDLELGYIVELAPSSALVVEVLSNGTPVTHYRLYVSARVALLRYLEQDVTDAVDGRTSLTDLPAKDLLMTVCSKGHGTKSAIPFSFPYTQSDVLSVSLEPGLLGHGRIEDAITGEPVVGAIVTQQVAAGTSFDLGLGLEEAFTNETGKFELGGFENEIGQVLVRAPGYQQTVLSNGTTEAGALDFGSTRLWPLRATSIFLAEAGRVVTPIGFSLSTENGERFAFDDDGEVHLGLNRDVTYFSLLYPDGTEEKRGILTTKMQQTRVPLEVRPDQTALIQFLDQDLNPVERRGSIFLEWAQGNGIWSTRVVRIGSDTARIRIPALPTEVVHLKWEDASNRQGLSIHCRLPSGEPQVLLVIGARENVELLVTDETGIPIESVVARTATSSEVWSERSVTPRITGLDGRVQILRPATNVAYSVQLEGPDGSVLESIDGETIEAGPAPFPVILSARNSLRLLVKFAGVPASDVKVVLLDKDDQFVISTVHTGPSGLVEFDRLGAGSFSIKVLPEDAWPVQLAVESNALAEPVPVELLPFGPVALTFLDHEAAPVAAASLSLEHLSLQAGPESWAKLGWIGSYPEQTDALGRARFEKLPAGTYRYELAGTPGGSFEIREGQERLVVEVR